MREDPPRPGQRDSSPSRIHVAPSANTMPMHRLHGIRSSRPAVRFHHSPRMFVIHLDSPAPLRAKPFRKNPTALSRRGFTENFWLGRCLRGLRPASSFGIHAKPPIPNRPASPANLERKSVRTFVSCAQGDDGGLRARGNIPTRNRTARRRAGKLNQVAKENILTRRSGRS